ncbi:AAA family ATPase [Pseudooceanicola marinus]|uniref:AAA family ATPase n=1 Tax=Pseudooceanicola marinus TaxID=396013 RepID=UPI001CD252BB|nr:ParA family protein [Pseudooceanicola marinus]MCA1334862.1 ParA family protein [Pseudooceanicola marinus]
MAGQIAYLSQAEEDDADYVVIDTPPHAGGTIDAAIRAADLVVIPIRPGPFDINAAAGMVEIMKQTGRPGIFVLSQVASVGPEGDDTAAVLQELYPDVPVAKARLGQRKAFMQALISGQAITEFDRPSSKAVGGDQGAVPGGAEQAVTAICGTTRRPHLRCAGRARTIKCRKNRRHPRRQTSRPQPGTTLARKMLAPSDRTSSG